MNSSFIGWVKIMEFSFLWVAIFLVTGNDIWEVYCASFSTLNLSWVKTVKLFWFWIERKRVKCRTFLTHLFQHTAPFSCKVKKVYYEKNHFAQIKATIRLAILYKLTIWKIEAVIWSASGLFFKSSLPCNIFVKFFVQIKSDRLI